jgi:hypothetical protein
MPNPHDFRDRRQSPRYQVELPVQVNITSSSDTGAFSFKNAHLADISPDGTGLTVAVENPATREEFAKMMVRRRSCFVICHFPGCDHNTELYGDIIWVDPRVTSRGARFRFGVCFDKNQRDKMDDMNAYLKVLAAREAKKPESSIGP